MRVSPLPPNIWSTPQPWIPNHRIQEEEPDLMFFAMICHHVFVLDMISTSGPSSATTALKSPCVCKSSPHLIFCHCLSPLDGRGCARASSPSADPEGYVDQQI